MDYLIDYDTYNEKYKRDIENYNMNSEDVRYHTLVKEEYLGEKWQMNKAQLLYFCKQFNEYHIKIYAHYVFLECSCCRKNDCSGKYCRGSMSEDHYETIYTIYTYKNDKIFSLFMYNSTLAYLKNINLQNILGVFKYGNNTICMSYENIIEIIKKYNKTLEKVYEILYNNLCSDVLLYICDFI